MKVEEVVMDSHPEPYNNYQNVNNGSRAITSILD